MSQFNEESIAKAKQAKSVEELLTLAKESGVEMTAEQAQEYYTQLNPKSGELADDELDNVAGGGCYSANGQLVVTLDYSCGLWVCKGCGGTELSPGYSSGQPYVGCKNCGSHNNCANCYYLFYNGMLLCSHPSNKQ